MEGIGIRKGGAMCYCPSCESQKISKDIFDLMEAQITLALMKYTKLLWDKGIIKIQDVDEIQTELKRQLGI